MLLQHESRWDEGTRTYLYRHQDACIAVANAASRLFECRFWHSLEVCCMAIGDVIICTVGSASLAKIPTVGCGPYTYIRAVVTRNGPALPILASPHVRGVARMCT